MNYGKYKFEQSKKEKEAKKKQKVTELKEIKKLLLISTGALMSPTSTLQGESIPGIAHAVAIEYE